MAPQLGSQKQGCNYTGVKTKVLVSPNMCYRWRTGCGNIVFCRLCKECAVVGT